jgi:formylglycine-generating enzyme required for sulfatase activity
MGRAAGTVGIDDAARRGGGTARIGDGARRAAALALVALSIGVSVGAARCELARAEWARCGEGFVASGPRCIVPSGGAACPPPLASKATAGGVSRICDAPDERILVPAASFSLGPSDWEAEGRVSARVVQTTAFRIDAFEATRAAFDGATDGDAARAASGMTRDGASRFCARRGGRLPSEDEWITAAASARSPARRYPWGDTGAVCRRAAWGLASGPCAVAADDAALGPDTVGAHPDGDTPLHLHDLAGNVAEWVAPDPADSRAAQVGVAKGGSWQSALAADLRIWARLELDPMAHDPRVGVRCAYPE